jgi:hypothetical protein
MIRGMGKNTQKYAKAAVETLEDYVEWIGPPVFFTWSVMKTSRLL